MPRPPAELRRIDDEERRRTRAHRRLAWERRRRVVFWIAGGLGILVTVGCLLRLAGLSVG
jgi:hypothetical protein